MKLGKDDGAYTADHAAVSPYAVSRLPVVASIGLAWYVLLGREIAILPWRRSHHGPADANVDHSDWRRTRAAV